MQPPDAHEVGVVLRQHDGGLLDDGGELRLHRTGDQGPEGGLEGLAFEGAMKRTFSDSAK